MSDTRFPEGMPITKSKWRQWAKTYRASLDMVTISQVICDKIAGWTVFQKADVVLSYAALPDEVNLDALMQAYPEKMWYLPRIEPNYKQMAFYRCQTSGSLVPNCYGIMEPQPTEDQYHPNQSALIMVPALMLDRRGVRLGFGQGYYDRFIPQGTDTLVSVCPIPQALWVDELPRDTWDWPIHFGISEAEIVAFASSSQAL